MYVIFHY